MVEIASGIRYYILSPRLREGLDASHLYKELLAELFVSRTLVEYNIMSALVVMEALSQPEAKDTYEIQTFISKFGYRITRIEVEDTGQRIDIPEPVGVWIDLEDLQPALSKLVEDELLGTTYYTEQVQVKDELVEMFRRRLQGAGSGKSNSVFIVGTNEYLPAKLENSINEFLQGGNFLLIEKLQETGWGSGEIDYEDKVLHTPTSTYWNLQLFNTWDDYNEPEPKYMNLTSTVAVFPYEGGPELEESTFEPSRQGGIEASMQIQKLKDEGRI
jgi:hypothetical protein